MCVQCVQQPSPVQQQAMFVIIFQCISVLPNSLKGLQVLHYIFYYWVSDKIGKHFTQHNTSMGINHNLRFSLRCQTAFCPPHLSFATAKAEIHFVRPLISIPLVYQRNMNFSALHSICREFDNRKIRSISTCFIKFVACCRWELLESGTIGNPDRFGNPPTPRRYVR